LKGRMIDFHDSQPSWSFAVMLCLWSPRQRNSFSKDTQNLWPVHIGVRLAEVSRPTILSRAYVAIEINHGASLCDLGRVIHTACSFVWLEAGALRIGIPREFIHGDSRRRPLIEHGRRS
jgi:hypothetical protein